MASVIVEQYRSPEQANKAEAGKLRRAVRTLRKELASQGQVYSTLNLKAMVLGVYTKNFMVLPRAERHTAVAKAFSQRLIA